MMKRFLFFIALALPLFACSPDESPEDTKAFEDMELLKETKGNYASALLETPVVGKGAQLGYAMATNYGYAAVGAPGYNDGKGAVLIYKRKGASFVYDRTIEAPVDMPEGEGRFGATVSLTDTYLAVGGNAGKQAKGVAYLYVSNGSDWTLSGGNLYPESSADYTVGAFGVSVSVSESGYLVVGAPETTANHPLGAGMMKTGYVFVYNIDGAGVQLSKADVRPDFITNNSDFGRAVACYGNDLVVGAPNISNGRGAAYLFNRSTGSWSIAGGDESASTTYYDGSRIGSVVAINSSYAVVGNGVGDRSFNGVRSALVYRKSGYKWEADMASISLIKGYGSAVATYGDRVAIGAPYVSRTKGAVFIFKRGIDTWDKVGGGYLKPDVKPGDAFGSSIAIASETYVVGASGTNGSEGVVYSAVASN